MQLRHYQKFMLWNFKTNKFGMYASGEGEAVVDINFCPNCGRKLI